MDKEQIIKKINNQSWTKTGHWQSTIIVNELANASLSKKYLAPLKIPFAIRETMGINDDYFISEFDFKRLHDFYFKNIEQDFGYLDFVSRSLDDVSESVKKNLDGITNLKDFFHELKRVESLGVAIVPLDGAIEDYLRSGNYDQKISEYVFPIRKACVIQERIDLLSIRLNQPEDSDAKIESHTQKYGWMKNVNWRTSGHDSRYYKELLLKIKVSNARRELDSLQDAEKTERKISKFLKSHDAFHADLLFQLRRLLDAKMLNWDIVGIAQNKWRELVSKNKYLSKLPYELVVNLAHEEVFSVSDGSMSLSEAVSLAKSRYGSKIFYCLKNKTYLSSVSENELVKFRIYEGKSEVKEIKGTVAYKGKVVGKISVLQGPEQINNMTKGNILVCPMTNPDLMPAILKCVAIVTDEGGLLCHAAIISREFRIPCIVGTKIATKIFRDGDMVEVDAEKGIVRKI